MFCKSDMNLSLENQISLLKGQVCCTFHIPSEYSSLLCCFRSKLDLSFVGSRKIEHETSL